MYLHPAFCVDAALSNMPYRVVHLVLASVILREAQLMSRRYQSVFPPAATAAAAAAAAADPKLVPATLVLAESAVVPVP